MKSLTKRLRRLRNDERGVSPVVGFVLIFALIMIVFTLYQSSVVPAQNKEVEFKHSQIVEGEMSQLNDAIQQAGTSGVPQSVTIDTGVQYPDRALAINPGSPAGTLSTSDPQEVTISGLSDGSGYWSSDDRDPFETRLVNYSSNYNLFQQETTYTLENGMFVKNFEGGNTLLESDGSVISDNGKRINLILVGGDYQRSQMTTSATVRPVSTSTEYHHLKSDGSGTIEIPTTLSRSEWQQILDSDPGDPGDTNDKKEYADFGSYDNSGDIHTVTINLDSTDETYELRLTKVKLGGSSESTPKYLKSKDPQDPSETIEATVGEQKTFTVSARDKYGNPFSGATVEAEIVDDSGSGTLAGSDSNGDGRIDGDTGDDGRVKFRYVPAAEDTGNTEDNPVTIRLTLVGGDTTSVTLPDGTTTQPNTVTYEVDVSDDTSGSEATSGGIDNGYPIGIVLTGVNAPDKNTIDLTFENRRSGNINAKKVRVNGLLRQGSNDVIADVTVKDAVEGEDTTITINGNLEPLNNPFSIPDGEKETMTLTTTADFNKGGFLIMYIVWGTTEGEVSDTYFVGVPS